MAVKADARTLLESFAGHLIPTVTGRPNTVLRVEGDSVIVATSRSLTGQPVPIQWVQNGLDQLLEAGEVEVSVRSLGHRSSFVGAVLLMLPGAVLIRTTPPRIRLTDPSDDKAAELIAETAPREHSPGAGNSAGSRADADHFYLLLSELARRVGGSRVLRDCIGTRDWPRHGVYFFFEDGEIRADGCGRVVRVGTHALIPASRATLWDRLGQHRGYLNGRNYGGGNHRASVFRRHVGAALIRRGNCPEALLASWLDRHPSAQWTEREDDIEREVSRYIGAMPFLWLGVPDRADRGCLERNSIALLSCLAGCQDPPSAGWLGHDAARSEIRQSGLWNVHHVQDRYDPAFLQLLGGLVQHMQ